MDDIALKLIRASTMLYKVRDFVKAGIVKAIFMPYLCHIFILQEFYGDMMYGQSIVLHNSKRKHQD